MEHWLDWQAYFFGFPFKNRNLNERLKFKLAL
jgi:hypothetical protein